MKKTVLVVCLLFQAAIVVLAEGARAGESVGPAPNGEERVRAHLEFLCSDRMRGRGAGTSQAAEAADYVLGQFKDMGLEARLQEMPLGSWRNVVAVIPPSGGAGPADWVVLGAHYDGIGTILGPVNNAADDNASGVAALIEAGRLLAASRGAYGVILVAFDAEEIGLIGSKYFLDRFPAEFPGSRIVLMMSLDMVGHLRDEGRLSYEGAATIRDGAEAIRGVAVEGLSVHCLPAAANTGVMTDSFNYSQAGIPAFSVSTDLKSSQYHRPSDELSTLDIPGVVKVARHVAGLTEALQGRIEPTGRRLYEAGAPVLGLYAMPAMAAYAAMAPAPLDFRLGGEAGVAAWLPFGFLGFARVGLKAEAGLAFLQVRSQSRDWEIAGLVVPVGLYTDMDLLGLRILYHWGAYYRLALAGGAPDGTADYLAAFQRHEFGLDMGMEFHVVDNIELLNHWGGAIDVRSSLSDLNQAAGGQAAWPLELGIKVFYRF